MRKDRKNAIAIACVLGVMGMTGAAFAAVPLYQMFCQVTGFDGTVRKADKAPDTILDQTVLVRFDTNVRGVPMKFVSEQTTQRVRIGETGLAYFDVTNTSDQPIQVRAGYNVVPEYTGPYFQKLQCFCFTDQTIAAGATVEMPVLYFIDPKYATDINTRGKSEVTLSYTFFPAIDAQKTAAANKRDKKG